MAYWCTKPVGYGLPNSSANMHTYLSALQRSASQQKKKTKHKQTKNGDYDSLHLNYNTPLYRGGGVNEQDVRRDQIIDYLVNKVEYL